MINIDFLTLKAFLTENIDFLIGARIQKIQQPTRRDFIFSLRSNFESKKLYINIDTNIYHICFMSSENEEKRGITIPKRPPMFCMLLRKYIEGAKISDVCVVKNDRIFELHFDTIDEFSQKRYLCLAVELMGKHSNVILYDRETNIIIGCAHNVGNEKSRYRELQGGLKYIYPPYSGNLNLSDELKKQFADLSKDKINEYLETENYSPSILKDRYTLFAELLENSTPKFSVNAMIDDYYAYYQAENNLKNAKNKYLTTVNRKLKKVLNSITKIKTTIKKRDNADRYRLYGELLTSNLYKKLDFQSEAELYDYVNNVQVAIPLDSTLTMSENAQKYFRLYTKSKNTKEKSKELLEGLNVERKYFESILYSIETANSKAEINEIESELGITDNKQNKTKAENIKKVKINNYDVYIGKNNKQNDYIISKLSRDDDYWFHTRLCAGSHVLLRVGSNEPDEETILECAKLAREYSSAKQPSKVGVIYTKIKYIKKPPSAPLGYVIYKNEKEILI